MQQVDVQSLNLTSDEALSDLLNCYDNTEAEKNSIRRSALAIKEQCIKSIEKGYMLGFASHKRASSLLNGHMLGTFLVRIGSTGELSISYVSSEGPVEFHRGRMSTNKAIGYSSCLKRALIFPPQKEPTTLPKGTYLKLIWDPANAKKVVHFPQTKKRQRDEKK